MFGGGITIENAGFDDFGSATKSRFSIQCRYHFGSTNFGSYLFGSSAIAINHPKPERVCKGRVGTLRRPDGPSRTGTTRDVPTTRLHHDGLTATFPLH